VLFRSVDGAGPAVYCARDGFGLGYCYALRIKNIDGDVTSSGRVSLIRVSANVTTNIASASLTDNPPYGPLNQHTWTIEANLENSTHANDVRLKVYMDGVLLISALDDSAGRLTNNSTWPTNARPGFMGGDQSTYTDFLALELP